MSATSELLENLRENLRNLPPRSPEWESDIPNFSAWLGEVISEKEAERAASRNLSRVLSDARERFSDDLRYLELDMSRWHERGFSEYANANVADVLKTAENFMSALSDYHAHPKERGATREETRRRQELEDQYADRVEALRLELDSLLAPPADDGTYSGASPVLPEEERGDARQQSVALDAEPPDEEEPQSEGGGENEFQTQEEEGGAEIPRDEAALTVESVAEAQIAPAVETVAIDAGEGGESEEIPEGIDEEADAEDAEPSVADLSGAIWEMVGQDDLAGAYWIAKSLESQGHVPPVPPHLLKAAQGARWLSPNSNAYVNDLFEIASGHEIPNENDVHILMGLAAALQASAIKDGSYLQAWLNAPQSCSQVGSVASPLRDFVERNGAARPEYVAGSAGIQGLDDAISQKSAEAREWLVQSQNRSPRYRAAADVLIRLCADGGKLSEMLGPVANDARSQAALVKKIADELAQNQTVDDVVNQMHAQTRMAGGSSSRLSPIVGPAKSWLVNRIRESKTIADEWLALVERAGEFGDNQWMTGQVSELRDSIGAATEDVFAALSELASDSQPPDVSASARCVIRAMRRLIAHLGLARPENGAAEIPAVSPIAKDLRKINSANPTELEVAVARRLVWTPAANLEDYGDSDESALVLPAEDGVSEVEMGRSLAESLRAPISLSDALRRRVEERQDFRFYDVMASALSDSGREALESVRAKRRRESESALAEGIAEAKAALEQAVRDGVMEFDDPEWKNLSDDIDGIERADDEGGASLAHVMDFHAEHRKIQRVLARLGEKRDERRADMRREWEGLLAEVRGGGGDSDAVTTWDEKFSQANSEPDLRVMETCVSRLRSHLSYLAGDGGERLAPSSALDFQPSGSLKPFMEFMDGIADPKAHAENSGGLKALLGGYQ